MCNMICAQDFVVFINSKAYFELSKQRILEKSSK